MTMKIETAEYTPDFVDITAPYTVALTLCNGRGYAFYPKERQKAFHRYIRETTMSIAHTNVNIFGEAEPGPWDVHIRMVTLLIRDDEGTIKHHLNSDPVECSHTN